MMGMQTITMGTTRPLRSPNAPIRPKLDLAIPQYGVVFMSPPEDARVHVEDTRTEPIYTQYLSGDLHVKLPAGCEPKRVESIYIGFKAYSKLVLDPKRPAVEDELCSIGHEIRDSGIDGEARWAFRKLIGLLLTKHPHSRTSHQESQLPTSMSQMKQTPLRLNYCQLFTSPQNPHYCPPALAPMPDRLPTNNPTSPQVPRRKEEAGILRSEECEPRLGGLGAG
jgi:hypothetical protein